MIPRRPGSAKLRTGAKLWGSRSAGSDRTTTPTRPQMKLPRFIPITTEGSALAYLDIELPSGLILRDCKLMRGPSGGFWIAMLSQKQLDRDGNPVIGDKGKPIYKNFVDFKDRATRDRFTAHVVDLIRREHPDIVDDEAVS
jgi:DNA-binding cell septation regulator SpoVG